MENLLNPYAIARVVCALDSCLRNIEVYGHGNERALTYTYEVAGKLHHFHLPLTSGVVDSIASLYPEAQGFEDALQRSHGIEFRTWEYGRPMLRIDTR